MEYTEYMVQMKVGDEWVSGTTSRGYPIHRRRNKEDIVNFAVNVASAWEQEKRWRAKTCRPTEKCPTAWRLMERKVTTTDWTESKGEKDDEK